MFENDDFWKNLHDEMSSDGSGYSEDILNEHEGTSVQYEQGWDIGMTDFLLGFRCRWIGGSDFADGYVDGYSFGIMSAGE